MHRDGNPSRVGIARREPHGVTWTKLWSNGNGWVCDCMVLRGDRLLLLLREYEGFLGGQWDLPGDKLDAGEEPTEATVHELREETGLRAVGVSEFARYSNPDLGGENFRFRMVTFLIRRADSTQSIQLGGEHPEFEWVTWEQLDELLVVWYVRRVLGNAEWGTISAYHGESD